MSDRLTLHDNSDLAKKMDTNKTYIKLTHTHLLPAIFISVSSAHTLPACLLYCILRTGISLTLTMHTLAHQRQHSWVFFFHTAALTDLSFTHCSSTAVPVP